MAKPTYDPDEALRLTELEMMVDGETFRFRVHNSNRQVHLMLRAHVYKKKYFPGEEDILCPHTLSEITTDPCAAYVDTLTLSAIKDGVRQSIKEHNERYHRLKRVK